MTTVIVVALIVGVLVSALFLIGRAAERSLDKTLKGDR